MSLNLKRITCVGDGTLRGFRIALGLLFSLDASSVTSRLVFRSNIRKKLL